LRYPENTAKVCNVTEPFRVSVIIPTLAEASRREHLLRAIDCILHQAGVQAIPLVVINGNKYDPALRQQLEARTDIRTFYRERASVTEAQAFGVEQVSTPFFSFLDDDDLYTEDALAHRLKLFDRTPIPDFVVTNFFFGRADQRILVTDDITAYAGDPAHSIFEFAWLWSANSLFRTAAIGAHYFRPNVPQMEWTSLAIRLTRDKRVVAFSNHPTAVYFDTPNSASKREAHLSSMIALMQSLRSEDLPRKTRRLVERKYAAALHASAERALESGNNIAAWRSHLRCLTAPQGWRYLSYTRRLLW